MEKTTFEDITNLLENKIDDAKITLEQYDWPEEVLKRGADALLNDHEHSIYSLAHQVGFIEGIKRAIEAINQDYASQ